MSLPPRSLACVRTLRGWAALAVLLVLGAGPARSQAATYKFNDSHFHLTNYIQEGTDIRDFLRIIGSTVGRIALFGIPLQQQWSYRVEFVSARISGEVRSLQDPALDRILDFAGEAGLVVLIHSDMDVPFAKEVSQPTYLTQIKAVFKRQPNTTIIWAHTGYTRVYEQYQPLWNLLDPETSRKVRLTNYEQIFNAARAKVRTWEAAHAAAANPR